MDKSVKNEIDQDKKSKKTKSLASKIILRIVTIIMLFALFCGTGYFAYRKISKVRTEKTYVLVDKQLSFCQELVTAKYRYSDIVSLKKASGFAKSYSIIKYSGIIRAGIAELTDISFEISPDRKKIRLVLPAAEILGNEMTGLEVFDEKQSIFVPISTQEIFDEIEIARKEVEEEMIAEGLLKQASEYSVRVITQLMYALNFEEVEVVTTEK